MDQLRTKRTFVRTVITETISTLSTLLEDPATPTGTLGNHLAFLEQKYSELIAFDNKIQATLFDTDLEADMAAAFGYQQKVIFAISDVRRATQSRLPTLSVSTANTARPFVAPLASPPQHVPIRASLCLSTQAPPFSCVGQHAEPSLAGVTSHVSDAVSKKLKPAQLCEVPVNGTTFAQPASLCINDDAAPSNTSVTSTVQQPTPAGRSSLPTVHAGEAPAVTTSPTSPRQGHVTTDSFASCVKTSELIVVDVPPKITEDGEKKKRAPPSSGFSKCSARSHSSTSKRPGSISRNDKTSSTNSLREQRSKRSKRIGDSSSDGSKLPSKAKEDHDHTEPPVENLRISSNVRATSSRHSMQLEEAPAPQDKPPPAATPPVATLSIAAQHNCTSRTSCTYTPSTKRPPNYRDDFALNTSPSSETTNRLVKSGSCVMRRNCFPVATVSCERTS